MNQIKNTLLLLGLITQSKQRYSFLQNQNLATAMAYYLRSVSKQHNLLLHIETNLIVLLSFASPWATPGTHPHGFFRDKQKPFKAPG